MLRRILRKLGIGTPITTVTPADDHQTAEERLAEVAMALKDRARFTSRTGSGMLRLERIDDLIVTSGRIVARDPLIDTHVPTFARQVAPSRYPVVLTMADFSYGHPWYGHPRVAYATVQFSSSPPVRWEMATRPSEELAALGEDDIFGYIVDAGTGSFMDLDAARIIDAMPRDDFDEFTEAVVEAFDKVWGASRCWLSRTLDTETGANFVAFSSGLGDDLYASYWGFGPDDNVVCLTTHFNMHLSFESASAGTGESEGT